MITCIKIRETSGRIEPRSNQDPFEQRQRPPRPPLNLMVVIERYVKCKITNNVSITTIFEDRCFICAVESILKVRRIVMTRGKWDFIAFQQLVYSATVRFQPI